MSYLWIDLWDKSCWIAYTNTWIIVMYKQVSRVSLISELKKIIKEKGIKTIVLWMPYDLYWLENKQLNKTIAFKNKLESIFPNINVETIDERFTTSQAMDVLKELNIKDKKNYKDSMSAYFILETYISKKNINLF